MIAQSFEITAHISKSVSYTVFSRDVSLKLKTRLPPYWCTISVNMACDLACNEFVVEKKTERNR